LTLVCTFQGAKKHPDHQNDIKNELLESNAKKEEATSFFITSFLHKFAEKMHFKLIN